MSNEKLNKTLSEVTSNLDAVKANLLAAFQECMGANGSSEWGTAERLFTLAKSADMLRNEVASIAEGGASPTVVPSRRTLHVEKQNPKNYPVFRVRDDRLVKYGLSRDRRSEYVHEITREEYDAIVSRLVELSTTKRQFSADDVQDGLECPVYKTYIVIAVFLKSGLVILHRRGTYKFKGAETFAGDVGAVWQQLATS